MRRPHLNVLDHIVLNVKDINRSLKFYTEVLGLAGERVDAFRAGKVGFPSVRINGSTIIDLFPTPEKAATASGKKQSGNLNHFCLVTGVEDFAGIVEYLKENDLALRAGPVSRWGARGQATSVYFLDPDGNEIEIRAYGEGLG
jgi:catechol 2,3-dioxygenase-like lactoylglutathione lyase family enzyme